MSHYTNVELECVRCHVEIKLTIIKTTQRRHTETRLRTSVNELLVDYGWLPTRSGPYCRTHAELPQRS